MNTNREISGTISPRRLREKLTRANLPIPIELRTPAERARGGRPPKPPTGDIRKDARRAYQRAWAKRRYQLRKQGITP